ncbi:hypothetical protein LCGC14_3037490, partial [marine sediment metagenome]
YRRSEPKRINIDPKTYLTAAQKKSIRKKMTEGNEDFARFSEAVDRIEERKEK